MRTKHNGKVTPTENSLYFLLPFARRTRTQRRSWDLGDGTPGLDAGYDFVEKPRPAFGFVDPGLDQACGRYIVVLVADAVRSAQVLDQFLVVRQQLGQHGLRR
jgi:hypothetical protein